MTQKGGNKIFRQKKFHRGIRNQKLGKVKKFQVWVVRKGQNTVGPYRVNKNKGFGKFQQTFGSRS